MTSGIRCDGCVFRKHWNLWGFHLEKFKVGISVGLHYFRNVIIKLR